MESHFENPRAFAVWHPNDNVRMSSSSGGAFTLLAEQVIKRGGVVFGAAWDDRAQVVITYAETVDGLGKLRESKYVAALAGNEYKYAKRFLDAGREVLYSGTPCQIAGLYAFLKHAQYPNLLTVDFICHGAPDRRAWEKYVAYLENKYNDRISDVHFRDKRWGVECNLLLKVALHGRGVQKIISLWNNTYYYGFIHNMFMRRCCASCRFNRIPRRADLSLADYRGLGEHVPFLFERDKIKGFTGVLVNSGIGQKFLDSLDQATICERPFAELAGSQAMLYSSGKPHPRYNDFWADFPHCGWDVLAHKYLTPSLGYIVYICLRRLLGPKLFLQAGVMYKKILGKRTTSWRV